MANTPTRPMRVPAELIDATRASVGKPDASVSVLVRAGLAVLAGQPVREALSAAEAWARPGPKSRSGAAA